MKATSLLAASKWRSGKSSRSRMERLTTESKSTRRIAPSAVLRSKRMAAATPFYAGSANGSSAGSAWEINADTFSASGSKRTKRKKWTKPESSWRGTSTAIIDTTYTSRARSLKTSCEKKSNTKRSAKTSIESDLLKSPLRTWLSVGGSWSSLTCSLIIWRKGMIKTYMNTYKQS